MVENEFNDYVSHACDFLWQSLEGDFFALPKGTNDFTEVRTLPAADFWPTLSAEEMIGWALVLVYESNEIGLLDIYTQVEINSQETVDKKGF